MGTTSYAIALGSNRRHGTHGAPRSVVAAAMDALEHAGLAIDARSTIRATPAMGGAGRSFANAVVLVRSDLSPPGLLTLLQSIERRFGRRPGRRWGPRVLDLDILLWSGGAYRDRRRASRLFVPHPGITGRAFVLQPLLEVTPRWRHPVLGLSNLELWSRLHRAKPVDRSRPAT